MSVERGRAWRLAGALCGIGLTLAHNEGVAFGLAGDGGGLLVAFALGSLIFIGWLFSRDPTRPWMWVAVGLLADEISGIVLIAHTEMAEGVAGTEAWVRVTTGSMVSVVDLRALAEDPRVRVEE